MTHRPSGFLEKKKKEKKMLTKGSKEYKAAQMLANSLEIRFNEYQRTTDITANNFNEEILASVIALNVFASEIAKTVAASRRTDDERVCGGYRMSSKQAWIIACASVEAGLNF